MDYMGYEIWGTDTEELLAIHGNLQAAFALADELAEELVAVVQAQLVANGEGHPGGIPVRLAVHDPVTGEPLGTVVRLTRPAPARTAADADDD
ncbi:MAG TPA: hypothetical protein VHV82_11170 [Sporichthyaceae bacterium]|jgi:hypothetical protein|nr:hypothetical protein [Sporichthyaceae bacterium]